MDIETRPAANRFWRSVLVLGAVVIFFLPGYAFFTARSGLTFLDGADFQTASRRLFPLVGLYAFFLVWLQVMMGSNRRWLRSFFPNIIRFHRIEGVFALLFALTHPTLLIFGYGLDAYLKDAFVTRDRVLFVWFGRVALFLIVLTAGSALLQRISWLRTRWRMIHYLNFFVFILVWFHSWNLGSDVQSSGLRYLWYFYGLTFVLSVIGRFARRGSRAASAQGVPLAPPTQSSALVRRRDGGG